MGITNVRDIRYLTNTKIDYRMFNDGHTAGLAYCTIEEWNESYIECEDTSHSDYLSPKIDLIKLDTSKSYVWKYNTSTWKEDDVSQWSVNYFNDYHILYGLYYNDADGWRVYTDASYTSDRRVNIYQNDFYTLPYNWANMPINQTITHTYTNQPLECNVMSTGIDDFCDYTDADTTRNGKVTNITTWSVNYSWTVPDQDKSGVGTINESTSFITKSGRRLYKVGQLNVSMSVYMRAIITTNSTTGLYEVQWSNFLYNSAGIKINSSTATITSVEANPKGTIEATETINFLYEEGSGSNVNPQLLGWDYVLNTLSVPGFLKKYTVGTTSTIGALAIKKNYSTSSTNYPSITLAANTAGNLWSSQVRTNKGRDLTYYSNVGINSTSAPVLTYNSWDWTTYPSSHKYKINVGVRNMYEFPIVYTTNDDLWDIYLGGLSVATSILFFTQTWSVTNTGATQKNNTIPSTARMNFSYRPLYTNNVTTQSISQTLTGSAFPHITNIGMGHNDMWVYYRNSSASTSPIHQILESTSDVSEYRHGYREYNVDGSTDELSQSANLLVNLGSSTISPTSNSVAASDHALYQYIFPADQATSTTAAQNMSVNWTNDTTQGSFYEIGMRGPQTGQTVHTYNSTSSLKNWILAEAYGSDISTASNPAHRTYSIANSKNIITYSRKFNNVFLELINVGNFTSEPIGSNRYDKMTFTFNVHCVDTTDSDAQIPNAYMICGICQSLKDHTQTNAPTWATQTIPGFAMVDDDAYWNKPLFKNYSGTGTPTCFTTIDSISSATYKSISNIKTTRQTITTDCYCSVKLPISERHNFYYSPFIPITLFWRETGNNLLEDRYYVKYYGLFYKDLTYTTAANWTTRDNWYLVPLDVNYRSGAITWKCWHQQKYSSELPFSTSSRTITLNPFYFFKDLYNSNSGTWIGDITPYFYREWATSSATIEVTKLTLTPPSSYTSTNVPASITYRCGGNASGKVYIDFYALALLSNNSADTMSSIFNHSYSLAQ